MKSYLTYLIILVLSVSFGCKKSEFIEPDFSLSRVKVYDDTLANGENPNIKISSGANRLYMTYGRGSTFSTIVNGIFLSGLSQIASIIMATDLSGNLIWRDILPTGLAAVTPIEMNNESCVMSAADLGGYNASVDDNQIYVFQNDRNGNRLLTDSFALPADFGTYVVIMNLDNIKISENEILIYGAAINYDTYITRGFAVKYNLSSGVQWIKPIDFGTAVDGTTYLYNCIKTNDGGLIFLGAYSSFSQPGDPNFAKTIVIKTDANCDTLWTKWFDYLVFTPPGDYVRPTNILQTANGDYFLCFNDFPDYDHIYTYNSSIYKLNSAGDSIGGYQLKGPGNTYCALILEENDNSILSIFNEFPGLLYLEMKPVFTQFNSQLCSFDKNLNTIAKSTLQTYRSDMMVAACKTPEGKVAMFGLDRTNNHQRYVPALIIKD